MMRALLFDLDDTLYPRDAFVQSGFAAVARHIAAHWPCRAEAVHDTLNQARRSGMAGREFQALYRAHDLPPSLLPTLIDLFRNHTPAIALDAGVAGMLQRLRAEGWRLGLVTNGHPGVQRRKIQTLGLGGLFDCVVYADAEAHGGKPHPAVFHKALAALRTPAFATIMVGDDPLRDVLGARLVGLHVIEVTRHRSPVTPPGLPIVPDISLHSVLDVPAAAASLLEESARAV
jgi:putative hydrolase of the HAD superfamily